MELSSSNIKKFLIFPQNFSYISGNRNPKKVLYILGNGTFSYSRKRLMFQEVTFRARKVKKNLSLKIFFIFS